MGIQTHTMKAVMGVISLAAATPGLCAQSAVAGAHFPPPWSLGQAFAFLFMALGPLNVIDPFIAMTQGRDASFRRRLAFRAFIVATIALFVAATLGAKTLQAWGISVGALLLTAGVILFLVALKPVLTGYKRRKPQADSTAAVTASAASMSELAFSPLTFPTIVTPYGMAVLIMLVTLNPLSAGGGSILGVAAVVLVLDLLAMLGAYRLAKTPFFTPGLRIVGAVMGILQVALGAQAMVDGLRLLGVVGVRI